MTDARVIFITCPDEASAARVAEVLVQARLAACANVVPAVRSLFHWEGVVQDDAEVLLILKSKRDLFGSLCSMVHKEHPYDVPEILALPVTEGDAEYLAWIDESTEGAAE